MNVRSASRNAATLIAAGVDGLDLCLRTFFPGRPVELKRFAMCSSPLSTERDGSGCQREDLVWRYVGPCDGSSRHGGVEKPVRLLLAATELLDWTQRARRHDLLLGHCGQRIQSRACCSPGERKTDEAGSSRRRLRLVVDQAHSEYLFGRGSHSGGVSDRLADRYCRSRRHRAAVERFEPVRDAWRFR